MEGQVVPAGNQQGNIALSTIIQYSIQRTYHELMVLSELLPRKTDMERKIAIVQYAHSTRQLFIRLLALVKWAKNGCKIDKCMAISNYLDQQAMLYIDTADRLSKLARGTLVQARLPAFSIPVAVDVLTSGTYPRLPSCIRDKIIPPDAITTGEESATLKRLSQIIEYRLVTSDIPRAFKQLVVDNGRVKLLVDKEFSVTLTVMGDNSTLPWRLLGIEILVEDLDSRDGKPLVHEMQIQYLHTLVQSRLVDTDTPLHELYTVLHTFCQSLQLEVLYSQTQKLIHEQLNCTINIEKYVPSKRLLVSYWRPRIPSIHHSQYQQNIPAIYKIDIHVNESDVYKPLSISHTPTAVKHSSSQLPYKLKSNQLSIEKILLETVHAWSYVRLGELQQKLESLSTATDFEISDLPPTLTFKIIKPCMDTECVRVAVDCQQGTFLVSIASIGATTKILSEIQQHLNLPTEQQKTQTLKQQLHNLKLWIGMERCRTSIQYIRTLYQDSLPFVQADKHPLSKLGANVLYIKVPLQVSLYVVVVVDVILSKPLTLHHKFYLLPVTACTFSGDTTTTEISKLYVKPGSLTRLDSNALVHTNNLHSLMEVDNDVEDAESLRCEESCYFVTELISVVNQCELRAEFTNLADCLWKEGVHHQGLQDEESGVPCKLSILRFPNLNGEADDLLSVLLEATVRVDFENMNWVVEFIFSKIPISGETLSCHQCVYTYDIKNGRKVSVTVEELLGDWQGMVKLYNLCNSYSQSFGEQSQAVSLHKFNFKVLQLCYGPSRNYLVALSWQGDKRSSGDRKEAPFELKFTMRTTVDSDSQNPHSLTANFLEMLINVPDTPLSQFMQVLCETVRPLSSIQGLSELSSFGLQHSSKVIPQPTFTILAQSATFMKISYRQTYLIDVILCENERVHVRDGAYGLFDAQPSYVNNFTPAQGLKGFLSAYEESDQIIRNQSLADEEHPPTPSNLAGLDTLDALLGAPGRPSPPTASRQDPSPKPTFQSSANSPAIAPSPLGGFGSPLDIQMTSPALPLNSPAALPARSPSSSMLAASPGLHLNPHGTPQGMDTAAATFPIPSPKAGWMNSPAAAVSGSYTLSPRAGGHSQSVTTTSPRPEHHLSGLQGRRMPQRYGYAALPTPLSHASLSKLLTPVGNVIEGIEQSPSTMCCPLERFLGSALLKRHLYKILTSDIKGKITLVTAGLEPGTLAWTSESFQCKVFMNDSCQALQLSVTPTLQDGNQWPVEELALLERYFSLKVVSPPFKPNKLLSFCRMFAASAKIVKEFIRIINKQLYPDPASLWTVHWCLTLPHETSRSLERRLDKLDPGVGAVLVQDDKIFYVLKFTRNAPDTTGKAITQLSVPFVYEIAHDILQAADKSSSNRPESSATQTVNSILQAVQQQKQTYQQQQMTAVYACCLEIMNGMTLVDPPSQDQVTPSAHMVTR